MENVMKPVVLAEKQRRLEYRSLLKGCSLLTLKCSLAGRPCDPRQTLISMILIIKAAWPGWKLLPVIQMTFQFCIE